MDKQEFLLEIGVEELPADQIKPGIDFLQQSLVKLLADSRLGYESLRLGSTPRRLAIYIAGLDIAQEDIEVVKSGPSLRICYNEAGELTPAGLGFLKKNNATAEDTYIEKTDKGEFLAIKMHQKGVSTTEILQSKLPELISQIPCTKRMIWNSPSLSFSRPIRWLVALWASDVLDLEVGGIKSGNNSRGIRILGLDHTIPISKPSEYFAKLKAGLVIADRDERKGIIEKQLQDIGTNSPIRCVIEPWLLEAVVDMVENPNAVIAEFDPFFLKLPSKIITSTISQNQKYFSIENKADGKLLNRFVFISNGDKAYSDTIRAGNEKVVKPRLADAMWYFDEDTKKPLESFVPALKEVVFHSKLGTVAAKSERIVQIAEYIADKLGLGEQARKDVMRAGKLCKADLVTLMLGEKEFTKLQGYIGREYALISGESRAVADAIYEHYMPRGQTDDLPPTELGAILAIADKLDTVCGILGIGLIPTGSGDPYALRRAANGIVQIIAQREWDLNLTELISFCTELFADKIDPSTKETALGFFRLRTEWLLKQEGLDYDIISSVMHIDISLIPDLIRRAKALQEIRNMEDFIRLVIGFKRVSNIIGSEKVMENPDRKLFETKEEMSLHMAIESTGALIDLKLSQKDYPSVLQALIALRSDIDAFFEKVLVNCEDMAIRSNRFALLAMIRREFLRVADLSLIVVEST